MQLRSAAVAGKQIRCGLGDCTCHLWLRACKDLSAKGLRMVDVNVMIEVDTLTPFSAASRDKILVRSSHAPVSRIHRIGLVP